MGTVKEALNEIEARLVANSEKFIDVSWIIKFVVSGPHGGTWRANVSKSPEILSGDGKCDCSVELTPEDFVALVQRKLNPQVAFMTGKLKFSGTPSILLELADLFE